MRAPLRLTASALLLLCVQLGGIRRADAVDLRDVLTGYTYTSWSRKDGLVGPVWAIGQDANGFLWLGTDAALIRFDGVRFTSWESLGGQPLPRLPIRALHVASDGTLWIGFGASGGIARIRGRTVTSFVQPHGAASTGSVTTISEDRAGSIWAGAAAGVFLLRGEDFERLGPGEGLPAAGGATTFIDRSGSQWVSTPAGLFRRTADAGARFQLVEPAAEAAPTVTMSEDPDGRLWASDLVVGFRQIGGGKAAPRGRDAGRGIRLLHARDGNLWVATIGQGLWRVQQTAGRLVVERTTLLSALSSDAVRTVFEDRDGNIWAGTTEGIDRLVPYRITPWAGLGLVNTIDASRDGQVWAGTAEGLIPFVQTAAGWEPSALRLPIRGATAVRGTAAGPVWVTTSNALYRVEGQNVGPVATPRREPMAIEALATDADGEAWIVADGGEVYRTEAGELRTVDRIAALEASRANAAMVDRRGHLWIAYADSGIGVLSAPGQFRTFGDDGIGAGPHYDIFEDAAGAVWLCGADGLSRLDGDQFVRAGLSNGLPQGGVYSMVEDSRGQIWTATSAGIIRLEREEFDRAAADPHYAMRLHIYDTSDGLAGYPVPIGDRNSVRAADGTLWFVTSRGISVADPRRLRAERPAPLVAIDQVRADDVPIDGIDLQPGTSKVEVDFTAPELTSPLKTRFRYRLEGFDADWIDAGTRRQALYTGLSPGDYLFRVAVSQDDGSWSEVEATWELRLHPQFWQTWWFYPFVALSVAGVTWAAWQVRIRQLRRQFALVLGERVRLSRELHDTLLQSLVGVALEFDAVSKTLETQPATARERVIKIREQVEEYIREARRSIWSLRSPALETGDLVDALRDAGRRAISGHDIAFNFEQSGSARRLSSNIEHQLLRIGQEAVLNAVRHAQPTRVDMRLHYGSDAVTLTVADNGRGFDTGATAVGTDHYGLTTMRERAQQAGGQLTVTSRPGAGTTVEATVPEGSEPGVDGA